MLQDSQRTSAAVQFPLEGPASSEAAAPHGAAVTKGVDLQTQAGIAGAIRPAIFRTQQWLLGQQQADGYWVAELEGDTILESEFLLLLAYLGEEQTPLAKKCAEYLVEKQTAEGGWTQYPGGEIDISASVKAYFALKLTGHDPATN